MPEIVTTAATQSNPLMLSLFPNLYLGPILENISALITRDQDFFKDMDILQQQPDRSE